MNNTTLLSYIAGLFDGEGCIAIEKAKSRDSLRGYRYQLFVTIQMREHWLLKEFYDVFGGSLVIKDRHHIGHSPIGRWRMTDKVAARFIEAILPYLRAKKEQALIALEFRKCKESFKRGRAATLTKGQKEIQDRCYEHIRELNKTGQSKLIPHSTFN